MNLLKEHVYAVCEAVSKYLEYLDNQVTRTAEAQNNRLIWSIVIDLIEQGRWVFAVCITTYALRRVCVITDVLRRKI